MQVLSDGEMESVSGQFGIGFLNEIFGLEMQGDTLFYHDADGIAAGDGAASGGTASGGAYLSFCGIDYQGSVTYGKPLSVQMGRFTPIIGGEAVSGLNIAIDDMTIAIDSLTIDAIRVGPAIGSGLSFGAFSLQGLSAHVEGRVQVYAH
ncbi:MAG: hypothetical protein P8010_21325 [Desulfosarcinaceae bacterium]